MPEQRLRLLIIGAHPDDADYHAGGLAALYRAGGHLVKMVSLTDGGAGHHVLRGAELASRRKAEAAAAGAVIGATYDVYDNPDGALFPTLDVRCQVIRLLRSFRPDLVLTHRSSGTLNLANAAGIPATAPLTISGGTIDNTSGAAFALANIQTWGGNFTFGGTNALTFTTGSITLTRQ